jgi:hypothetical protein
MTKKHRQVRTIQIAWRNRPRADYCPFCETRRQRHQVRGPPPSRESIPTSRHHHTERASLAESTSRPDPKRARNIQSP